MLIITKRAIKQVIFEFLYLAERAQFSPNSGKDSFDEGYIAGRISSYHSLLEYLDIEYEYIWFKDNRKKIQKESQPDSQYH